MRAMQPTNAKAIPQQILADEQSKSPRTQTLYDEAGLDGHQRNFCFRELTRFYDVHFVAIALVLYRFPGA